MSVTLFIILLMPNLYPVHAVFPYPLFEVPIHDHDQVECIGESKSWVLKCRMFRLLDGLLREKGPVQKRGFQGDNEDKISFEYIL